MRPKRRGFTLVELLVVITIIGILLAFILRAYTGTIRVAEKSATISLIAKLEAALIDRMDALSSLRAEPNWCHYALAGIWPGTGGKIDSNQRAQVIAQYDYIRAELPDVFVLELGDTFYPINFGALPFSPIGATPGTAPADYNLPLGGGFDDLSTPAFDPPPVTGMKGASFAAAAAVYKQLGATANGMNGADDNLNGLIDELVEGFPTAAAQAELARKLANHTHKTARSEMLYAILVEGTGPLGSVFNRDDFNENEIKDTDNDGLMEFVDAYGEPLQFFRWPIMYRSETQKGFPDLAKITQDVARKVPIGPYTSLYESRQQDPLDPNQTLQSPGWILTATNPTLGIYAANVSYPWGDPRTNFGKMFHTLVDPLAVASGGTGMSPTVAKDGINTYWDRSAATDKGYQVRRAYYSRFLVLSGGPDKKPGVARLSSPNDIVNYQAVGAQALDERGSFPVPNSQDNPSRDSTGAPVALTVQNVIQIENQGGMVDPNRDQTTGAPSLPGGRNDTNTLLEEFGHDDISNHNLHSSGGPLPTTGK